MRQVFLVLSIALMFVASAPATASASTARAEQNVMKSNFGGQCGKRLSRICLKRHERAHCGGVLYGGWRRCTGFYEEYAPGILWGCHWKGAIRNANPHQVASAIPITCYVSPGHL